MSSLVATASIYSSEAVRSCEGSSVSVFLRERDFVAFLISMSNEDSTTDSKGRSVWSPKACLNKNFTPEKKDSKAELIRLKYSCEANNVGTQLDRLTLMGYRRKLTWRLFEFGFSLVMVGCSTVFVCEIRLVLHV